jgi:hypothetical protein
VSIDQRNDASRVLCHDAVFEAPRRVSCSAARLARPTFDGAIIGNKEFSPLGIPSNAPTANTSPPLLVHT